MAKNKLMSINEALDLINDGDEIAIGGMSFHRNPMSMAIAIVKSNKRDLALVDREPGLAFDLLTISGRVKRIRAAWSLSSTSASRQALGEWWRAARWSS